MARTAPLNLTRRFVYIQVRERSGWEVVLSDTSSNSKLRSERMW